MKFSIIDKLQSNVPLPGIVKRHYLVIDDSNREVYLTINLIGSSIEIFFQIARYF